MKALMKPLLIFTFFLSSIQVLLAQCQVTIVPISPTEPKVCRGGSIELEAQLDAVDTMCNEMFEFKWSNGGAVTQSVTFMPMMTTRYSVTITDINDPTNTSIDTIDIIVNENPTSLIFGQDSACINSSDPIILTGVPSGGSKVYNAHSWVSSDPNIATVTTGGTATTVMPKMSGTTVITYTVTDSNGCEGIYTHTFTVLNGPNPSISFPTGLNRKCLGLTDTVVCVPNSQATPFTFNWTSSAPGVATVLSNNPSTAIVSTVSDGSTIIICTVTDANGCTAVSNSLTFTVLANPTANIMGLDSTCEEVDVELQGNPSGGSLNYQAHEWMSNNTNAAMIPPNSNSSGVTIDVGASGFASIFYTVTDSEGCIGSDNILMEVLENPIVNLSTEDTTACQNETIMLEGNPSGGFGSYIHTWTSTNTGVATVVSNNTSTAMATTLMAGLSSINYKVEDEKGCIATGLLKLMVNQNPTADAGEDQAICNSGSTVLGGNPVASGGTPPYQYDWGNNITTEFLSTSPTINTSYTLTIKDIANCSDIDEVNVVVFNDPSVDIIGAEAVCSGDNAILVALHDDGPGNPSYKWEQKIANEWVPISIDKSVEIIDINSTVIIRVILNFVDDIGSFIDGCESDTSSEHIISVTPIPNPSIMSFSNVFCQNEISLFYNDDPRPGSTHLWSVLTSSIPVIDTFIDGNLFFVHWPSQAGATFTVQLTEIVGDVILSTCRETTTFSVTLSNNIAPDPAEIFRSGINNILIYNDADVNCYQWGEVTNDSFMTYSGEIYQSYVPDPYDPEITYWCRAWNTPCDACATTAIYRHGPSNGTVEIADPKFLLYPNPNNGNFQLEVNKLFPDTEYEVRIVNMLGQIVLQKWASTQADELSIDIHLAGNASGVYIMGLYLNGVLQRLEPFVVQP